MSTVDEAGCWLWTGRVDAQGRAKLNYDQKTFSAARVSYAAFIGEIGSGLVVCHRCDNPTCVNPEHLFLGSVADNNRDCREKGRHVFGSRHAAAKLSESVVANIRRSAKGSRLLCKEYSVDRKTIRSIKSGRTWKHVDG